MKEKGRGKKENTIAIPIEDLFPQEWLRVFLLPSAFFLSYSPRNSTLMPDMAMMPPAMAWM